MKDDLTPFTYELFDIRIKGLEQEEEERRRIFEQGIEQAGKK